MDYAYATGIGATATGMLLGMSLSAISPHLRLLRNLRLVKFRKDGRTVYYSLDDDHVRRLLEVGIEHARE